MDDWVTISALATAGGTLVLSVATFAAVRSANRAGRVAERSLQIGLRPILAPSRLEDPPQRIMFQDRRWLTLRGGKAAVELADGVVYLAMMLRNMGNGMAVIEAWLPHAGQLTKDADWGTVDAFIPQTRDLWVPPGDVTFWQGALRDEAAEIHQAISAAVLEGFITIDLSYFDHEGGQRTMSRFALTREEGEKAGWWVTLARHHTVEET